ncbi:MAG TPA: STAS domain-containing protein [Pyrinomonadaceae bacterium]|nr:STAS domain-containing protein [Pyrinomonadaceae bacterium]
MLKIHAKNQGSTGILCLQGRLVNGETEVLRKAVDSLTKIRTITLDLARVTAVDARGLGVMLELREQAEANGIRFELMNVTRWVRRVLEVTRLDSVFQISTPAVEFSSISTSRPALRPALAA